MKISKITDILLNVFFPLCTGFFLYYGAGQGWFSPVIKNYLPDGLWAYAFISALLITWDRKAQPFWIMIVLLSFITVEFLQYRGMMAGTGDIGDLLIYLFFCCAGLIANIYFQKQYTR